MDTRQVLSSNSFIHFLSGCNAVCEINLFISAMEIRTNTFVDFLSVFFHAVCNSIYKKGGEMKLTTRTTHAFIEIKVDEIETTVFKSSPQEIQSMIENLLDVVNDLASYTDKSVKDYVEEGGF